MFIKGIAFIQAAFNNCIEFMNGYMQDRADKRLYKTS